ncbi:FAD-dependent oxidoreductase [Amnibacterium endophyticum]|uniref:FAD-dependent oxidoreductase n=1 Tax=Amnibacterium endophyticum TaxID=2109337 RepID=A0ABW4LH19_9MICO
MSASTGAVLVARREIAARTLELAFEPEEEVPFLAGQYCRVEVEHLRWPDRRSSRKLSIVNAPSETGRITIAVRSGDSGYKRTLAALEPGERVRIQRVKGDLVLPASRRRPLSFIAGGIGVVPFVSMLRELDHRGGLHDVRLLLVNRDRSSVAYLDELRALAAANPGFVLATVMTRDPGWQGERRRLGKALLQSVLGKPRDFDHYVVGTPRMVDAAVDALRDAGVKRKRIHEEDFSGYTA